MTNTPLGAGKEFDAIRSIVARLGVHARGIGDDAALLDIPPGERLVISTDTSVEHVHFKRDWLSSREIGWRAAMAALSDLAAMGATPLGMLTAMTVPSSWRGSLESIADGIADASAATRCPVVGGDTSSGSEFSICATVLGTVRTPLLRSGARAGDSLWVTGQLGGPAMAVRALQTGCAPLPHVRARFARPEARIVAGIWLAQHGCTAAIDVSDGLVADARHIAVASNRVLTIALEAVPCIAGAHGAEAATSGEEYELLVSGPASLGDGFASETGLTLTRIGSVADGSPDVVVTESGARVEIGAGYDHFSS